MRVATLFFALSATYSAFWFGLAAVLGASPALAQNSPLPRNAFAGFETVILRNGLKIWFKRLPGDPTVSVSVSVRAGSDQDPPGREQLAHFTEHMLFSDHLGRTDEQIKHEIDDKGGAWNGVTYSDHTFYFTQIGKAHGLFAIGWLYRLISPHAMDSVTVEKQREPVALETRAQPRQFFDQIFVRYVNPPWLRLPDFWEREFGLVTSASRDVDLWESLHRIAPADLRGFYDRYYVPSRMTVTVIGDVDRDSVMQMLDTTFATLAAHPAPADTSVLRDPGRGRREYFWDFRSSVSYTRRYKFYDLTAREQVVLIFLGRWLSERLNDRLRFGNRKAVYGLYVGPQQRGRATVLRLSGGIKPSELGFALGVIEDEIEGLRSGGRTDVEFETGRTRVARQLRIQDASAKELESWVERSFYDERVNRDFPDLVAAFENIPRTEVEGFVRRLVIPNRQVLSVGYRIPLSQGLVAIIALGAAWLAIRAARRLMLRPLDMTRLRYVARFRLPLFYNLVLLPVAIALLAIGLRLLVYGGEALADHVLFGIDQFWVQWPALCVFAMALVFVTVLTLGWVPRKLLCFDNGIAIKFLTFRSVSIAATDITEVTRCTFAEMWLSRRLWSSMPLTLGIRTPGILVRTKRGRSYFFKVRDSDECVAALQRIVDASQSSLRIT